MIEATVIEATVIEATVIEAPVIAASGLDTPAIDTPAIARNEWNDPVGSVQTDSVVNPAQGATQGATAATDRGSATLDVATPELLTFRRGAMLATGLLTLVAVRRRTRLRQSDPGTTLRAPTETQAATERSLRSIGTNERAARIDIAVRAAAVGMIEAGQRLEAVMAAPDGELELIASGPVDLAPPFTGAGRRWTLPASTPIELLAGDARRVATPCPALAQIGIDDIGRDVVIDIEALEAIEIGGAPHAADSIVAAVAATLAGSVLAEVTNLVSLDVPDAAFFGHRLHRAAASSGEALAVAAAAVGSTASMTRSTFELRARASAGETWEPCVLLVGSTVGTFAAPSNRRGLGIVSASPILGRSARLAPEGDWWVLRPLGIRIQPVGLAPDDLSALADLAAVDDHRHAIDHGDRTIYDSDDWNGHRCTPIHADLSDTDHHLQRADVAESDVAEATPEWSLLVRVLGPVGVVDREGTSVEFERAKTRELVAWLATHRLRSTRGNARTALWEHDVRDATFANVVSEARRSMARLVAPPEGEEWLARTLTESLPLHAAVCTDADVVSRALERARTQPPTMAIDTLESVIDLIAGVPFEGTAYTWPDAEGITSQLIVLAISATAALAEHQLSVGDVDGVFRSTGRGLQVLPGHEHLIGLRMRAHARAGDLAGVRQEWERYERTLGADPWSDGEPAPKLVELRRQLLNPSR